MEDVTPLECMPSCAKLLKETFISFRLASQLEPIRGCLEDSKVPCWKEPSWLLSRSRAPRDAEGRAAALRVLTTPREGDKRKWGAGAGLRQVATLASRFTLMLTPDE